MVRNKMGGEQEKDDSQQDAGQKVEGVIKSVNVDDPQNFFAPSNQKQQDVIGVFGDDGKKRQGQNAGARPQSRQGRWIGTQGQRQGVQYRQISDQHRDVH